MIAPALVLAVVAALALTACGSRTRKLDQVVFHEGPQFKLKLARYHENLPMHYVGEVFRVQCASARTADAPAHRMQDAGWVTLGNGGAIGSANAAQVAERERGNYRIIDERTLAWLGTGVSVSFDACGEFRGWYPTLLPADMIDPVEKPEYCAPRGTADCRHYDFLGDRAPAFEQLEVRPDGRISFVARSKSIRPGGAVRVESPDSGRTWAVTPLQK
ncbi:MAG: hypothetical protein ACREOF_04860 [Gemmatimonadales bacterium]